MRKTGSVTQKEVELADNCQIISSTDLKSRIVHCNEQFVRYSGYSRDALIGEPHNILRHPDMPQAAFESLWRRVQAGQSWMGIVKNRTKNGDHYWVSAYVTPLLENGEIVGYESVRTKPSREEVARAEHAYGRILAGQPLQSFASKLTNWTRKLATGCVGVAVPIASALVLSFWVSPIVAGAVSVILGAVILGLWIHKLEASIGEVALAYVDDPLAQFIYTGAYSTQGQVQLAMKMMRANNHTVLESLSQLAEAVSSGANKTSEQTQRIRESMGRQKEMTSAVVLVQGRISESLSIVNQSALDTFSSSEHAVEKLGLGNSHLQQAISGIHQLASAVSETADIVEKLAHDSHQIRSVLQVIAEIADQTNLLALNAAIEAARAGEQGRGFAVVADEVRNLARRTQESTQSITEIISNLTTATSNVVTTIHQGQLMASDAVEKISQAGETMSDAERVLKQVDQQASQIIRNIDDQKNSIRDLESHTNGIDSLTNQTVEDCDDGVRLSSELGEVAADQMKLIRRFR